MSCGRANSTDRGKECAVGGYGEPQGDDVPSRSSPIHIRAVPDRGAQPVIRIGIGRSPPMRGQSAGLHWGAPHRLRTAVSPSTSHPRAVAASGRFRSGA